MSTNKPINVKRTFTYILVALAVVTLYFGLVHLVLMVANVSKPAPKTVYGLTSRRQWTLVVLGVALVSVILGWRTLRKSASRISTLNRKRGGIAAIVTGLIAVYSSGMNLATANGGPGTGNGVLGSAQALLLGLTGMVLGGLAVARLRRNNLTS